MTTQKKAPTEASAQSQNHHRQYTQEMLKSELPSTVAEAAHWWFEFGFTVIPIDPEEKHPSVKWQPWIDALSHDVITDYWLRNPHHDLGAVIDDRFLIADADSPESLAALHEIEKRHDVQPNLIVDTKNGQHHYFKRAEGTYAKQQGFSSIKHPAAIDIKTARNHTDGRSIVVLPPSTNKFISINEAANVGDLCEIEQDFIDAIFKHNGLEPPRKPAAVEVEKRQSRAGKHEIKEILEYIDPESPAGRGYEGWLDVLMGVHERLKGDALGIDLLDDWSSKASNYCGREVIEYKYSGFAADHLGGVTFNTPADMAKQAGANLAAIAAKYDENGDPLPTFDDLLNEAQNMNEETPEDVIQRVVDATRGLSSIQRRRVFDTIKRKTKLPLTTLKDALRENAPESDEPDHLTLAKKVVERVGRENIIAAHSFVWGWDESGVWKKQEERTLRQFVHEVVPPLVESVTKNLIEGVTDLFKTEVFSENHEFDLGEPESVNCLNGELSLFEACGAWTLEKHRRENYRTTQIPISYDPEAKAPRFAQFMAEVFKGDPDADDKAKALLEMMGYSLMAHCRHERFIILVGAGANGKSVLLSVLEELCGSTNVAGVQPSQFDNKFQRAHLHGKLANIVTEIEQGEVIADAALKGIVSGEPTTVEHKHKDPFMMRPFATCWFGTNHMPHTRDFSDALFRRALVVSFNNVFKPELGNCDPMLKTKLMGELPGILNMALAAYADAIENGFTMPASSDDARKEWRLEADQVAQFVEDECTRDDAAEVLFNTAFRQYENWASTNGINKRLGSKSFRDRLTRLGFGNRRDSKARYVTGLRLDFNDFQDATAYRIASNGE